MLKVLGVDLGGTYIKAAVVDEKGDIFWKKTVETPVGYEAVAETIAQLALEVAEKYEIAGVGIGTPGSIDHEKGVVRYSPNLKWRDVPFADLVTKKSGCKTYIENDANAFVLGEKWFGAARGCEHVVALTFGTGIGGGVISHGRLITGHMGIGAELGHIIVEPYGPLCGCGSRGCLESIASASAVARLARQWLVKYPGSIMLKMVEDEERIDARVVFEAYKKGDLLATIVVEYVSDAIARAVGAYVQFFNPEVIVFGGGMAKSADMFIPLVERRAPLYMMPSFIGTYRIVKSELLEDAGIKGAASIVFENLKYGGRGKDGTE